MNAEAGYMGRYELQELLGQGGMTEVWKAFDNQARQYVTIKFLHTHLRADPDFAIRFQREAQLYASLRHPNIIQYHDFFISQPPGTGNMTACMVMDYVNGGTLSEYIRNTSNQGKFWQVSDMLRFFMSIGAALDYAHQQGVIHGQLKPANILLDQRNTTHNPMGNPVVTDFAIARLLVTAASQTSGWWMGTPLYMAPEQITGSPADVRSDIYSLGCILYEIWTGAPPFPGNNPTTIMSQHVNTIPLSPAQINPAIPSALVPIIMRCLAKDPALRFASAAALMTELTQVSDLAGQAVISQPISVSTGPGEADRDANLETFMSSGSLNPRMVSSGMASTPALPVSVHGISGIGFSPLPGSAYSPFSSSSPFRTSQSSGVSSIFTPTASAPDRAFFAGPGLPPPQVLPPPQAKLSRPPRRRRLAVVLSVLLALLVIGSGLGVFVVTRHPFLPSAASSPMLAGHAYFVSSGLLSANPDTATVQGITDELEVRLEQVPQLPLGKGYYGWLLNAKSQAWQPVLLKSSALAVNNGTLTFSYPGDAQHTDLLATYSRFLITVGDIAVPPLSPDAASLVYYADFPEVAHPFGAEQYSLYDHIRHLLANDPKVVAAGLTGGLDIWLYRNTQKILEWAGSARDADLPATRQLGLLRRQLTRIIDYLDGSTYSQLKTDLPGQDLLVDQSIARIGLLTFDTINQDPPGYLYHIEKHLHEVANLPESTPEQRALALQINQGLNAVDAWDHTIRTDVLTLFRMNDTQLTSPRAMSLLNEVATLANQALVGQVDPLGQVTPGVIQVHYAIQRLATFDVRPCSTANPCPALV